MKRLASLLLLFALAMPAFGQSVTLPSEIKGAVGAWIIIAPEKIDGGEPKYRIDAGLQEVRLDLLLPADMLVKLKGKVVTANVPGIYKVESWNAKADVASLISTCMVIVGTPQPLPPNNPPPAIIPPVTPPVTPPAPIPSALQQSLQVAYDTELDPKKSANTGALADLFGSVVAMAKASGTVKTHKDFQTKIKAATDLAIGPAAIPKVRTAVGAFLVTVLPTDPFGPADDAYWSSAAIDYKAVSDALNGVKR